MGRRIERLRLWTLSHPRQAWWLSFLMSCVAIILSAVALVMKHGQ
jgi:hypothetical protein